MTVDVLYVTHEKDHEWFRRSLEVVCRNLNGYRHIHVVFQDGVKPSFWNEIDTQYIFVHKIHGWPGAGYLWQQWVKLNADTYSDADFIIHIDSDVFIDRPTHVDDYFVNGKPSWLWCWYSDLGPEVPWQVPTQKATGLQCEREFMEGFPFIVDRRTYPRVRQWIEDHTGKPVEQYLKECAKRGNTSFSEFNAMGAIAFEAQHELYWWVDRNRDQWPKGFHSTRQFWSHRPVTDHKEAIDQMLSQDTTQQLRTTNRGIWVLTNDTHISRWVEQHGRLDFDGHLLPRVLPYIKPGMTVVDVGAFIGDHTHAYAKAVLGNDAEGNPITTGRVLAFEPNPMTFECLSRNMQGHGHVECINKGLSSAPGRMSVSQSPNAGAAFLVSGTDVEITTLDSYGLHACDLIKIDAEGLEFSILQGAWQTIARHNPVLVLEINLGALDRQGVIPEDIYGWLKLRGYKHIDGIEGGTQFDIIARK
jgi:FkbM family methyltransferase